MGAGRRGAGAWARGRTTGAAARGPVGVDGRSARPTAGRGRGRPHRHPHVEVTGRASVARGRAPHTGDPGRSGCTGLALVGLAAAGSERRRRAPSGGAPRSGCDDPTPAVPVQSCHPPTELPFRSSEGRLRLRISTEPAVRYSEGRARLRISTELRFRQSEGRVRLDPGSASATTSPALAARRHPALASGAPRRRRAPPPACPRLRRALATGAPPPNDARPVQPASPGQPRGAVSYHPPLRHRGDGLGDAAAGCRPRPAAGRAEAPGCGGRTPHQRCVASHRRNPLAPGRPRTAPRPARPTARSSVAAAPPARPRRRLRRPAHRRQAGAASLPPASREGPSRPTRRPATAVTGWVTLRPGADRGPPRAERRPPAAAAGPRTNAALPPRRRRREALSRPAGPGRRRVPPGRPLEVQETRPTSS